MPVRGKRSKTFAAVALQARVAPEPEGRVGGQGEEVRQEVARLVHDVDRQLAVLDADVDVEAEDQVGARDLLQVLDDVVVAPFVGDQLVLPVGERVGARGGDAHAVCARERR